MNNLLRLFEQHPDFAAAISIGISILVAVAGVVPSVFVTAANIFFFGFAEGTLISFAGEAIGAQVAFVLYRKGFKKQADKSIENKKIKRLLNARGKEAFQLIFSLRLIPFIPSGLITFTAAIGQVSTLVFFIASSLGKIPALLMEAWSVYEVGRFSWQGKLVLAVAGVALVYFIIMRQFKSRK